MHALDTYVSVFLNTSNSGNFQGNFQLSTSNCCYNGVCPGVSVPSFYFIIQPHQVYQSVLHLTPPAGMGLFGLHIVCNVAVYQFGDLYLSSQFSVNTTSFAATSTGGTANSCNPPNILWEPGNIPYCFAPCSIDQSFNSVIGACQAVDCVAKYGNAKPFFDPTTFLCTATTLCSSGQIYSPVTNKCLKVDSNNVTVGTTPHVVGPTTINCTVHGYLDTSTNTSCLCYPGWYTSTNQDLFHMQWCTVYNPFTGANWSNESVPVSNYLEIGGISLLFCFVLTLVLLFVQCWILKKSSVATNNEVSTDISTEGGNTEVNTLNSESDVMSLRSGADIALPMEESEFPAEGDFYVSPSGAKYIFYDGKWFLVSRVPKLLTQSNSEECPKDTTKNNVQAKLGSKPGTRRVIYTGKPGKLRRK